jgi:hypothetical protein
MGHSSTAASKLDCRRKRKWSASPEWRSISSNRFAAMHNPETEGESNHEPSGFGKAARANYGGSKRNSYGPAGGGIAQGFLLAYAPPHKWSWSCVYHRQNAIGWSRATRPSRSVPWWRRSERIFWKRSARSTGSSRGATARLPASVCREPLSSIECESSESRRKIFGSSTTQSTDQTKR